MTTEAGPERRSGQLLKRLPGASRPRREVLADYEEWRQKRKAHLEPVLWSLLIPEATALFRWRVQLNCGCIQELHTSGKDRYPDEVRWPDPLGYGPLPEGELACKEGHTTRPKPYHRVAEWRSSRIVNFDADPEECPDDTRDPEVWAIVRRPEPHASRFWRVTLDCGHSAEMCADVDWKPEDGPHLASSDRLRAMAIEFEEYDRDNPPATPQDEVERDHWRRMVEEGWPRPRTEYDCFTCTLTHQITGYQRVGWLVPPPKPPAPRRSERELLAERLLRAEAEAAKLRKRLDDLH